MARAMIAVITVLCVGRSQFASAQAPSPPSKDTPAPAGPVTWTGEPCGSPTVVTAQIESALGRPLAVGELTLTGTVTADGAMIAATLDIMSPRGRGQRVLTAPTCDELLATVGLVVAIAIEPSAALVPPPPPPLPPEPQFEEMPLPPPPAKRSTPLARADASRISVAVTTAISAGPADSLQPGLALRAAVWDRPWRLELAGHLWRGDSIDRDEVGALSRKTFAVRTCRRMVAAEASALLACLSTEISFGAARAMGDDFLVLADYVSVSTGGGLEATLHLHARWWLHFDVSVLWAFRPRPWLIGNDRIGISHTEVAPSLGLRLHL